MSWNPEIYMGFADERTRPAADLLARIPLSRPSRVVDLGCGPGNSTALLRARWPEAKIEGLESSPDMLDKARRSGVRAEWVAGDIANWSPESPCDVIFSNAALQWLPEHEKLLPGLVDFLNEGGALAFQTPRNFDAPSHVLMREVAQNGPWAAKLAGVRSVHVLSPEQYFDLLSPLCTGIDIWETIYLHVLEGDDPVFTWVSGTGLRPFEQPLEVDEREEFIASYRAQLGAAYPRRADGKTLFPFRRLFVAARR